MAAPDAPGDHIAASDAAGNHQDASDIPDEDHNTTQDTSEFNYVLAVNNTSIAQVSQVSDQAESVTVAADTVATLTLGPVGEKRTKVPKVQETRNSKGRRSDKTDKTGGLVQEAESGSSGVGNGTDDVNEDIQARLAGRAVVITADGQVLHSMPKLTDSDISLHGGGSVRGSKAGDDAEGDQGQENRKSEQPVKQLLSKHLKRKQSTSPKGKKKTKALKVRERHDVNNSNANEDNDSGEEGQCVVLKIKEVSSGGYVVHAARESSEGSCQGPVVCEEGMLKEEPLLYNLQMLGEVALKEKLK